MTSWRARSQREGTVRCPVSATAAPRSPTAPMTTIEPKLSGCRSPRSRTLSRVAWRPFDRAVLMRTNGQSQAFEEALSARYSRTDAGSPSLATTCVPRFRVCGLRPRPPPTTGADDCARRPLGRRLASRPSPPGGFRTLVEHECDRWPGDDKAETLAASSPNSTNASPTRSNRTRPASSATIHAAKGLEWTPSFRRRRREGLGLICTPRPRPRARGNVACCNVMLTSCPRPADPSWARCVARTGAEQAQSPARRYLARKKRGVGAKKRGACFHPCP